MNAYGAGRYRLLALLCLSVLAGAMIVSLRAARLARDLGRTDTFRQVKRILVRDHELPEAAVTPDAVLATDLRLDELDMVELAMQVEEAFGVEISDEEYARFRTVRDVVACIEAKSAARRARRGPEGAGNRMPVALPHR